MTTVGLKNYAAIVLISTTIFFSIPLLKSASAQGLPLQFSGSLQNTPDPSKASVQVAIFADAGHGATCALPAYAPSDYLNDMALDLTTATELDVDMGLSVGDLLFDDDIGVDSDPSQCEMTYQQFMEHMNLPFFQTFGNHDIASYGRYGADWSANPYRLTQHVLNETEINTATYAVSKNNILFLILGDKGSNYKLHNTQYEWLEYMTSRYPNQTTVIVSHQGIWGTTPSGRSGGAAEYTWYDNAPWWAAFFANNPQVKVFVHGHNHEYSWVIKDQITSEKYVQGHGMGDTSPYSIGHPVAFIEAPTHHKNHGPHNVNQFTVLDVSSAAIEWRLWKHDGGGAGFWSDPNALVQPSIYQWTTATSFDAAAADWYSFPVFMQDGETQIIDSKVFAEDIRLELIGSDKRELFTNPELDYFTDYAGLGFVGFTGEDPSRSLNFDDGVMRVAGPRTIEYPSRYPDDRMWDGGKSGQMKNWFFHGSVPQLVPGAQYEIAVTARASQPAALKITAKSTDWANQNQYDILTASESTVIDVTVDQALQTYTGTYTAPADPNVWFITGEVAFNDTASYEIHAFSIKRVGTSDVSENYRLQVNDQWYAATGPLGEYQYQQFAVSPGQIAAADGKIHFLSEVTGSKSAMARVIYHNPVLVRGGLIKVNSFTGGDFNVSVVADVSSDKWKDLSLKLLPLDNEVTFSIDPSDFESRISPNGRVYGAETGYSIPEPPPPPTPALIAHWKADQNTLDSTALGHDGTFVGTAKYAAGHDGDAFDFDLTNYVRVEDADSLDVVQVTVAAWIYPRSWGGHTNGLGRIVSKNQGTAARGFNFIVNKDYTGLGNNNLAFRDQNGFVSSDNNSVSLNTWQHVVVTASSSEITFYINGVNAGTHTGSFIIPKNSNNLNIGASSSDSLPELRFDGLIDEVKIWNYVLNENEVIDVYNGLEVPPANSAPVAGDDSIATDEDQAVAVTLAATDVDGDPLTYSVVSGPSNGVLTGSAPDLIYTPNPNYHGTDAFTFKASDGSSDSNIATVSLTIRPVNDAYIILTDVTYTTDGTLAKTSSPYVVQGTLTVDRDATLIVEAGTIIKFETGASLVVNGTLVASGTAEEKIVFTSWKNDLQGGDTNDDGSASLPAPGDWGGIHFANTSADATIEIFQCTIEYGTGVRVTPASPDVVVNLTDSIVRLNSGDGAYLEGVAGQRFTVHVIGNQFLENSGDGLYFYLPAGAAFIGGNISNNRFVSNSGWEAFYLYHNASEGILDIRDNTIDDHNYHGIWLDNFSTAQYSIADNYISGSGTGIAITAQPQAGTVTLDITGNELAQGRAGLHLWAYENAQIDARAYDNEIHDNSHEGISCDAKSDGAVVASEIRGNQIYRNGGNGIECLEAAGALIQTRILANQIHDNGGWGISCKSSEAVDILYNFIDHNTGGVTIDTNTESTVSFNNIHDNFPNPLTEYVSDLVNGSSASLSARHNFWGAIYTAAIESGPNPRALPFIYDRSDSPTLGRVDYSDWLQESIETSDTDSDGLSDLQEGQIGVDPQLPDTDGDGAPDGLEVSGGSDPADGTSKPYTVYEDAEDGLTLGWEVYTGDPANATIDNVFDAERQNRVIELTKASAFEGFRLRRDTGSDWDNAAQFVISWRMKVTEPYVIFVEVDTTVGYRSLKYDYKNYNSLGSGWWVHHGLGSQTLNGQWQIISRNLQTDLSGAQSVQILSVKRILVHASGRFDDIRLMHLSWDGDGDGLTDFDEVNVHGTDPDTVDTDSDGIDDGQEVGVYGTDPKLADSDGDGMDDGTELAYWGVDWDTDFDTDGFGNLVDEDADNDGALDAAETAGGHDPADPANTPAMVYEDGEDGLTMGWDVYTGDPSSATIDNVFDAERQSQVIELTKASAFEGFRLRRDTGSDWNNAAQFVISWRMRVSEPYAIFVEVETTAGLRWLKYDYKNYDSLGSGWWVHHGLGSQTINGRWQSLARNLQADLSETQPGVQILSVKRILVHASGRFDDIQLMHLSWDGDGDGLTDFDEVNTYGCAPDLADTDVDGINDGDEVVHWGIDWDADYDGDGLINLVDEDSDNDGILDGGE